MHDTIVMEEIDCFTNLPKYLFNQWLGQLATLNLLEEGSAIHILEHHVSNVPLPLHVVIHETHDMGVFELLVHGNLILGILVVYLSYVSHYHFDGYEFAGIGVLGEFNHTVRSEADIDMLLGR